MIKVDRIPVFGILIPMIRSFGDKQTEALFQDEFVRRFQGVARPAKRKLEAVNAASRLVVAKRTQCSDANLNSSVIVGKDLAGVFKSGARVKNRDERFAFIEKSPGSLPT